MFAKQRIMTKKLANALDAFCQENPIGNPAIGAAVEKVICDFKSMLEGRFQADPNGEGTIVLGAATALRDFIENPPLKMPPTGRRPYPPESE
jgi:hypothetical protein